MESENLGRIRVLVVDLLEISPSQPPASPLHPPPPIQGNELLLFSPTSAYICTRLIKYSTSPLLPMGPAILRGEGLSDSDRDRPRVAWEQRWQWGGGWATLSLRLLFIQIPSSASEDSH